MELMKGLDEVDLIVTDIPYGVVNRNTGGLRSIDKSVADSAPVDISSLVPELTRLTRGSLYVWCGTEQVSQLRAGFVEAGLTTRVGVWEKSNPSPMNGEKMWLSGLELCVFARKPKATFNRHCKNPIWRGATQRLRDFPCPKPIWLMEELVTASSNPGDTVLDPFMGSGSTGVACVNTGRNFIGIELDPEYFRIAEQRIGEAMKHRNDASTNLDTSMAG